MIFKSLFLFSTALVRSAAYQWPSPQYDALEEFLYEGVKADGIGLGGTVLPCRMRTPDSNHSAAAEWLRMAYHDVATYNISDGTGGLDGSIAFEVDREENIGQGMKDSLNDFLPFPSKYVSRSDIIAVSVLFAVTACGGPTFPFRGGRIDANSAGPLGVPDIAQDLATHTAIFARQGFTASEMTELVACGHTLGGVRTEDFPNVVPANATLFDSTPAFDVAVVQEYLNGSTRDPLVIGANSTLMSDLRIFSQDNNSTMQSMSTPETFSATCARVLEKMINIVPKSVTLTDEIIFLPAKATGVSLTVDHNDLLFKVSFRYINSPSNSNRVVTLFWCDRYGAAQNCVGNVARYTTSKATRDNESPVTVAQGMKLRRYDFAVHLSPDQSIQKFWFTVDEKNGTAPTTYDNGGSGYVIDQDQVLFVPSLSHKIGFNSSLSTRGGGAPTETFNSYTYGLTVGVRNTLSPKRVYLDAFDRATTDFLPFSTTIDLVQNSSYTPVAGYNFYTGSITSSGKQTTVDTHIDVDGTTYTDDFKQLYAVSATATASPPPPETGTDVQTTSVAAPASSGSNGAQGTYGTRTIFPVAMACVLMLVPGIFLGVAWTI